MKSIDVTDGRFADSSPVFTLDGLYLAFLSQRSFNPVYDTHTFDLAFPLGGRPYLVPLAEQNPVAVRPAARRPATGPGRRRGSRGRGGRRGRPGRPGRAGGGPPGGGGALRLPAPGQGRPGVAARARSPACSARAAPARTTTGRVRRCSASTCASARSRSWPAGWTGSASAATAPGSSSATTTSCGSSRRRASTTTRGRPSPSTCPGPGSRPTRPRCGGTPTARQGGTCAGISGTRTCPGWTGTAYSATTGRCSTGSAARPTSPTCSGRCWASSARRTRT